MGEVTTYVGGDAHKKDLFVAMLVGDGQAPVTWTVPNEPKAVGRGSEARALRVATPGDERAGELSGDCAVAHPVQTR